MIENFSNKFILTTSIRTINTVTQNSISCFFAFCISEHWAFEKLQLAYARITLFLSLCVSVCVCYGVRVVLYRWILAYGSFISCIVHVKYTCNTGHYVVFKRLPRVMSMLYTRVTRLVKRQSHSHSHWQGNYYYFLFIIRSCTRHVITLYKQS